MSNLVRVTVLENETVAAMRAVLPHSSIEIEKPGGVGKEEHRNLRPDFFLQFMNNERGGNISVTRMHFTAGAGESNPAATCHNPKTTTPMKIPKLARPVRGTRTEGFTLIELLVVISIIAILAGFALPVFTSAQKKGRITDSLSNCKQINLALRMYATDNDGVFPNKTAPSGGTDGTPLEAGAYSNQAFENLMPKYTTSKKIFGNKASAYCKSPATDNGIADANKIQKGQNDWLYLLGLTDTSDARWPLIATATKSAGELTYTSATTAQGGVWGGTDAVVGFCDGSARPVSGSEMNTNDPKATFIKNPTDTSKNMLVGTEDWLGIDVKPLLPQP